MANDRVRMLVAQLASPDAVARHGAATALGQLAKDGSKDTRMLASLVRCLGDADGEVRHAASTALGWLSFKSGTIDRGSMEVLLRCLGDDVAMVRHDAAWILEAFVKEGIRDPRPVPLLVGNTAHADPDVRAASVYCLGLYAATGVLGADVRAVVERLAQDPEEGVRRAVATALASWRAARSGS